MLVLACVFAFLSPLDGLEAECNQPGVNQECYEWCTDMVEGYCAGVDLVFGTTTVDVDPKDSECTDPPSSNPPGGDDYDCSCGFRSNPAGLQFCRFEFYTDVPWGFDAHYFKDHVL